jgi:hypothetical protein
MKSYSKLTFALLVTWFLFALIGSAVHLFRNDDNRFGIGVALAAGLPIVIFAGWAAASRSFRQFLLSVDVSVLTLLHSWRLMGFTFVLLEARGVLPAIFALPAGYGDMLIGATATWVGLKLAVPEHRASFIAWQALGILDLVTAVTLGTTARLFDHSASMVAMTVLPLSLIPTFLVPLFLIFHAISIAQARAWKAVEPVAGRVALVNGR